MTSNYKYLQPSAPPKNTMIHLSTVFCSDEGCRILIANIGEEYKLLQTIKKFLEDRLALDKQYARNLQELAAKADRLAWRTNPHSIVPVCHTLLSSWSSIATKMDSNIELFRNNILDSLLKDLLEQKYDSKKFFEDEKRQYEAEHQKAINNVLEAEKRYLNEAKTYVAKNNELTKFMAAAKISDDTRILEMKRLLIGKRDNLYYTHNEYVLTIREYNFIDEQYIRKVQELIDYHEETQIALNQQWKSLLEAIANYMSNDPNTVYKNIGGLQELASIAPCRSYDEICKTHSEIPLMTKNPIVFNEIPLQTTGLNALKANEFIVDDSASAGLVIDALRQKIQTLTEDLSRDNHELSNLLQNTDKGKDKDISYNDRKNLFQNSQQIENLRIKTVWKENLKNDLEEILDDAGITDENSSDSEALSGLSDRLEDQPYFHGVMPRTQTITLLTEKGDYLIRINNQDKIVLSILWPDASNKLKDGHYFIHQIPKDNTYAFQTNSVAKPTVPKLIKYYTRQKLELRDDGTRLIRAIEKPNYIINNDEIKILKKIGEGNFGEVFRGEYRNMSVAVKTLRLTDADRCMKNTKDQDFINEALVLKKYKHKSIVNFIGIAAYREPLMIVMEFIEQGSLNNYLKQNDLRVSQLTQICYEISKGMAYLERFRVIHRDLAARNCLVDKNGRVKVADFGLSRCLQDDQEYFSQTKQFPVRWWAVEVLSKGPYTNKSDVWSYGITMWEIFCKAALPYTHIQQNNSVIDAVKRGERLKQPDKCPANIFAIMANCWLSDPQDRNSFAKIVELLRKEKSILPKFPFFNSFK